MSAPGGSEDFDDNFREVVLDRIAMLAQELTSDQLLGVWATLQRMSVDNG